jgi:hypothetical protein
LARLAWWAAEFALIADYLSGALLADCGAEGAQIINSAPIQAARRLRVTPHAICPVVR